MKHEQFLPYVPNQDGLLISVSGIDGSGKTSLINRLAEFYTHRGLDVLKTTQPTSNYRQHPSVRMYQSDGTCDVSFEYLALLSALDRLTHVKELHQELKLKDIILCDRYLHDGIVSFVNRGLNKEWIESINYFCPPVHVAILVDCPGEIAYKRILKRGLVMTHDEKSPHTMEVKRKLFLKLSNDSTFIINGSRDPQFVFEEALKHINNMYKIQFL